MRQAMEAEQEATEDKVFTVSQLTGLIKTMLEGTFPSVQLKGEISNFRPNASGHLYFVLKDNGAQISAVMFRGRAASLAFTPKDGMLVQVRGAVSVYPPRGNYQIIISSMTKAGSGDIMEMIEERKRRLAEEGLFDESRRRPLPFFPRTVGVVTSPTGAALRDILQIARRRNDKVSVIVLPAIVQGEGAAESIVRMIRAANVWRLCDVLIVGRGGGSLEDLLPFSEESVVRAVAASAIPVVSAVGHEIDWALCDFAADKRAPTPSAAAELVIPIKDDIVQQLQASRNELRTNIESRLQRLRLMLRTFTPESMELQFRSKEQPLLARLEDARSTLEQTMSRIIDSRRNSIGQCVRVLEACSPEAVLRRGYAMVTDGATGKIIRSAADVTAGAQLCIRPAAGRIRAQVTESIPDGGAAEGSSRSK